MLVPKSAVSPTATPRIVLSGFLFDVTGHQLAFKCPVHEANEPYAPNAADRPRTQQRLLAGIWEPFLGMQRCREKQTRRPCGRAVKTVIE
jgi:hypothetical protein